MFDSMFIGLSGMSAYSSGLRQVSNNITNLNSSGYKASEVSFADMFSGETQGLSYSSGTPSEGGGVTLRDGRVDYSQGELRQTDRDLDLAIDGGGFLVLNKDGQEYYTRTGSFEVNDDGDVVLAGTEYRLTTIGEDGRAVPISIDAYRTSTPEATTMISFADNLSSTGTSYTVPDLTVYDANGEAESWSFAFSRAEDAEAGQWELAITNEAGDEVAKKAVTFTNGVIDADAAEMTVEDGEGRSVVLDFSEVSSFSSGEVSTMRTEEVDGSGVGQITGLTVDAEGSVEVSYSNGRTEDLGAVTIAEFREPQSLEQRSGGLFTYDSADGRSYLSSDDERVGRVVSRRIEASNVDLSSQFGDLILVQRGYQASSQVVSVSNDMIQQLFGLRGRG